MPVVPTLDTTGDSRILKDAFTYSMIGERSIGRPWKRWSDSLFHESGTGLILGSTDDDHKDNKNNFCLSRAIIG